VNFYETVTAAVRDITDNGYDPLRVDQWLVLIKQAAERSLTPTAVMERTLRASLASVYARYVDKGAILKLNPGVSRFTLDQIKPKLRTELDRRIMASAQLIRLNREAAIQKTLQRFSGWSTSIPQGGSDVVDKNETKGDIKKSLKQLPFEERRVIIDQGHKLVASISEILATDGGAIAGEWHSHWRQKGYNYRKDHKERDRQVYAMRGNWAMKSGLMKCGPAGYTDDITQPGEEVFCFPGDSKIPFAYGAMKAFRRWYAGELTEIVCASGKSLRGTPNHPILTDKGWVALGALKKGDYVIEIANQLIETTEENQNHAIPTIAEIFGTLQENGITHSTNQRPTYFHGDASEGDVDIVNAARPLTFGIKPQSVQPGENFNFSIPKNFPSAGGTRNLLANGLTPSAQSLVSSGNPGGSLVAGHGCHADNIGSGAVPPFNSAFDEALLNGGSGNSQSTSYGKLAFSSQVCGTDSEIVGFNSVSVANGGTNINLHSAQGGEKGAWTPTENLGDSWHRLPFVAQPTEIIDIKRSSFSGHVYNLQTVDEWYVADGIIAHNCRCWYRYIYSPRYLPDDMLTEKGKAKLEESSK